MLLPAGPSHYESFYPYSVDVSTTDGNFAAHGYYNSWDGAVVLGYN